MTNSRRRHSPSHTSTALGAVISNSHNSSAGVGINNTNNTLQWQHHSHHIQTTHHGSTQIHSHHNLIHQQSNNLPVSTHSTVPTMASAIVANTGVVQHSSKLHLNGNSRQQTITIRDTPSPAVSVITISDSEDETPTKW